MIVHLESNCDAEQFARAIARMPRFAPAITMNTVICASDGDDSAIRASDRFESDRNAMMNREPVAMRMFLQHHMVGRFNAYSPQAAALRRSSLPFSPGWNSPGDIVNARQQPNV